LNPQSPPQPAKANRFPFARFFLVTGLQFLLALGLVWIIAPKSVAAEITHPWSIVLWTFFLGIPLSLFEYLYHRYLLHSAVLPFMGAMHDAHDTHHRLTSVKARVMKKEPELLVPVENNFPVEYEEQEDSMMFPAFALSVFNVIFLVMLGLPLKLLLPGQPILVSLLATVMLCYSGYELWHAILHVPFEKIWGPLMDNPRTRGVTRYVYSFHLMHHWRPTCNLAVVGFWGFAVWDHLFRTHRRPYHLPIRGALVSYADSILKRPLFPIALLDRWQVGMYKASRKVEQFTFKLFVRKPSTAK